MFFQWYQTARTLSLSNTMLGTTAPGTRSAALLHEILIGYGLFYAMSNYVFTPLESPAKFMIVISTPLLLPLWHNLSDAIAVIDIISFSGHRFDFILLTVFDLMRLNCVFGLIRLHFFPNLIPLTSNVFIFTQVTQFKSDFSIASRRPTLERVFLKYSNTEIVGYSTILIF